MKALVLEDFGRMAVHDRPDPVAGEGEVLIRVSYTGICGSDLHGYTGANGRRVPGQVMGHETVGRVASPGPLEGRLVTVNPVLSCGACAACRGGAEQWCATKRVVGVDPALSSAFAEYLVVPTGAAVPLPESMREEYGALVEPMAVGLHAVRRGAVGSGDAVLVIGGGPIGQAVALAARSVGAGRVAVSELNAGRRALCASLGVDVIDPGAAPVPEQVRGLFGGPAAVAVDAVGVSATLADAFAATPLGGRVVLVGMGSPRVDLGAFSVSTEERSLIGSFSYPAAEFRQIAEWVAGAPDELAHLVERRVPVEEAPDAFATLAADLSIPGKVLVRF